MMSQQERKMKPELVRYLWNGIRQQKQNAADTAKISKYLIHNTTDLSSGEVENFLTSAVDDGFVEVSHAPGMGLNRATKKNIDTRIFKIPNIEDIHIKTENEHDLYCFECHNPKNLQNCTNCIRSFHIACMTVSESDNSIVPSDANNPTNNPTEESMVDVSRMEAETDDSLILDFTEEKPNLSVPTIEVKYLKKEIPNLKDETVEEKPLPSVNDVVCVGEVRPPSRRRRNYSQSYKFEQFQSIDLDNGIEDNCLCRVCRVRKRAEFQNPPNMNAEELNYLLKFIFDRVKTWISADTFSPLPFSASLAMPSKKDLTLFQKICLKVPISLDDVDEKLKGKEYKQLADFHCDILDIQHSLGVLYGTNSAEYEATKYLVTDSSYELSEIRQCRDCYRHSNEKSNKFWFCKPCVPRHELVFAKQIGYSYWPAKVIKVKDNQYDVRFFGAQHSRALIEPNFVKPIDTELNPLKIKKSVSFNKAMEELRMHEHLLQLPPGSFSYEAELKNPVQIPYSSADIIAASKSNDHKKKSLSKTARNSTGKKKSKPVSVSNPPVLQDNTTADTTAAAPIVESIVVIEIPPRNMANGNVKRKRNYVSAQDFPSSNESEESTISDYITGKRAKISAVANIKLAATKGKQLSPKKKTGRKKNHVPIEDVQDSNVTVNENIDNGEKQSNSPGPLVSSAEDSFIVQKSKQTPAARIKGKLQKSYSDAVLALAEKLDAAKNQSAAKKLALDTFQAEIDKWQLKMRQLIDDHTKSLSEAKRNQWCTFCEKKAIYHCCWNTTYCSTDCQQSHWDTEHKNACRRKL